MVDQLYPYVIQTVQALLTENQIPSNVMPEYALASDNWQLADTMEYVITEEVCFLFELRGFFLQIEIKTKRGHVIAINVIKDLTKKISYDK